MPLYDYEDEIKGGRKPPREKRRGKNMLLMWFQALVAVAIFSSPVLALFLIDDGGAWNFYFGSPPPDWLLGGFQQLMAILGQLLQIAYEGFDWFVKWVFE